jgi:hypothetical protein
MNIPERQSRTGVWVTGVMTILMLVFTTTQATGADETAIKAIDAFEAATKSIQSYDIVFKCEKHFVRWYDPTEILKAREEMLKARLHPNVPMKQAPLKQTPLRLIDLPKPIDRVSYWREVKSGQKFRIEKLEVPDGKVLETRVTDGVTARYLTPASGQGAVAHKDHTFVAIEMDYECLYRNTYSDVSLTTILRKRAVSGLVRTSMTEDSRIEAPAPAKPVATDWYPYFSFSVTCDTGHGKLPKRIERKSSRNQEEIEIEEFQQFGPNAWAPIRAKALCFLSDDGTTMKFADETKVTVDVTRSRWNIDVPTNEFTLRFPPGIEVWDRVRNLWYVAGSPTPPVKSKP